MLCSERPPIDASCMTISDGRTEEHVIIGFGVCSRLEYSVSILSEYLMFNS